MQPTVVVQQIVVVADEEFNHPIQSTREGEEHDGITSLLYNDIMEVYLYQNALRVFVFKEIL